MNRTKIFIFNSVSAAIYQIVILIVGFIVPRIMMEIYGSEINGLISSITQFITYFNLVEGGLSGAAVYALYAPLAKKDNKSINAIVNATKQLYCQAGFLFSALLLIMSAVYPFFVKSESIDWFSMSLLILILGTSAVIEFFTLGKYRALLTANQELYVISFASIIYQIFSTLIVVVLVNLGMDVVWVKGLSLLAVFARTLILYIYVKIKYVYLDSRVKPLKGALSKRWDAFYLTVLGAVHSGVPVILATFFTDLIQVSIFGVYNMILSGLGGIVGIFTNGLSSSFGNVIAKGEKDTLKKAYNEFEFAYYVLIALCYGICMVLILPFIKIYTKGINDANYCVPSIAVLITLNGLFYNLKTPQGMLIISAGHYRETRWQTTAQGMIAVLAGFLLAPVWGIQGIIIGSILSNLYRDVDLMFYVPKKIVGISVYRSMRRMILVFFEMLCISVPFSFLKMTEVQSYLGWIIYACIVSAYAVGVVFLFSLLFDRATLKDVCSRVWQIRKRRQE